MKITLNDLMVLVDTLGGSLNIADGGRLFTYAKETRLELWKKLYKETAKLIVTVEEEK